MAYQGCTQLYKWIAEITVLLIIGFFLKELIILLLFVCSFVCFSISSVGVSRSKDVPSFGPPIPKGVTFPKSAVFRDFLLAKVINAENAAHKSEKFRAMATRTRQEYLKDLAENFVTTATVDTSAKFSFITLGAKKKEKVKPRKDAHLFSVGAIMWNVIARDFGQSADIECLLGISNEFIMLIEKESKNVVFNCSCRDVIGWTSGLMSIKIFYERGECILLSAADNCTEDIREIVQRLEVSTVSKQEFQFFCEQLFVYISFEIYLKMFYFYSSGVFSVFREH